MLFEMCRDPADGMRSLRQVGVPFEYVPHAFPNLQIHAHAAIHKNLRKPDSLAEVQIAGACRDDAWRKACIERAVDR